MCRPVRYRVWFVLFAFLLYSCGKNTSHDPDSPPLPDLSEITLRGPCALEDRLGAFVVYEDRSGSSVQGEVADGVVPITILTELRKKDGCRLMQRENPACQPPCAADQTCDFDQTCKPYPRNQDLGEIRVDGLHQLLHMTPRAPGNNYFETSLPQPLFDPGMPIRITSTDGFLGEIEMYGMGVAPLELLDESWPLIRNQNLNVSWNQPADGARSRIRLEVSVDQHGATPVFLICDLPDSGSASVPAELVDELINYGTTGFPSARLIRQTVDSQQVKGKGCVEFIVGSPREPSVDLSG